MLHEITTDGYLISDDPARLQIDAIHGYLRRSYWAAQRSRETIERSLRHSLCIGIYTSAGEQVGLVRVVSDEAVYAYLCDVYVVEAHRGKGLSKSALRATLAHPRLKGIRRYSLLTQDAHGLYAQFGFTAIARPERYMEMTLPAADGAPPPPRTGTGND